MRYLAAYMLCQLGGKESPSADDVIKVLDSVGVEHEAERLKCLLNAISGKDVSKLIAEGSAKLTSVPTGASASVSSGAPAAAASASDAGAKEDKGSAKPAAQEKVEEPEEEEDFGLGLFD